ncbi:MAG: dipicolinate synthase subunit B [Clostridiales bacterium]|jgi:dipicolinate synthase subunit B|nr:dipicolinate synthase subunit B [Clostridiales bacterium]
MNLDGARVGFAMTGSFCTFGAALGCLAEIVRRGAKVTPVLSHAADTLDTRFMTAAELKEKLLRITGAEPLRTIVEAEPIGPKRLLDILLVLPATGNTLAKMVNGITDTPALMAIKSHLRNNAPVVIGVSTNDALGTAGQNIGRLLTARNVYFVPFYQDDPALKPRSLTFSREYVTPALEEALEGRQIQPIITSAQL